MSTCFLCQIYKRKNLTSNSTCDSCTHVTQSLWFVTSRQVDEPSDHLQDRHFFFLFFLKELDENAGGIHSESARQALVHFHFNLTENLRVLRAVDCTTIDNNKCAIKPTCRGCVCGSFVQNAEGLKECKVCIAICFIFGNANSTSSRGFVIRGRYSCHVSELANSDTRKELHHDSIVHDIRCCQQRLRDTRMPASLPSESCSFFLLRCIVHTTQMTSTYSVIFPNCGMHTKGETDGEKFAHLPVENIIISIVLFHHSYLCVPLHCKKNLKGRKLKFFGGAKAKVVKVENDRCKQRNFSKQTTGSK